MINQIIKNIGIHSTHQAVMDLDMHSHILPWLDNGPKDIEISVEICRTLYMFGIRKCIMTPHVMAGYYENTEFEIHNALEDLKKELLVENIPLKIKYAAEYFIDEPFFYGLKKSHRLLTLDPYQNHVLISLHFLSEFEYFKFVTQRLSDYGYIPVLAHAEKYNSLFEKNGNIGKLKRMGLRLQSDLSSIYAHAPKTTKENLKYLNDNQLIDFIGTNIHDIDQCQHLIKLRKSSEFENLFNRNIKNNLLDF